MTTTQDLILGAIEERVDKLGLRYIEDHQYSNTGHVRVYDPVTLVLIGQVSYDFQQEHCNFGPMSSYVAVLNYGRQRTPSMIEAVCSTVLELVDRVVAYLTKATKP